MAVSLEGSKHLFEIDHLQPQFYEPCKFGAKIDVELIGLKGIGQCR